MRRRAIAVVAGLGVFVVAGVAGVLFVVTRGSSAEQPDIWGARGGTVPGLVVLDDSFKRWSVTSVDKLEPTGDPKVVGFSYSTPDCDRSGVVGYRVKETTRRVILTVVLGSTGQCQPRLTQPWGRVTLAEPLGDRHVVSAPIDYPPGTNFFQNG